MNKLKIIGPIVLLACLGLYLYNQDKTSNPFEHVEWIEDSPGATERYVTFTPVLRSNKKPIGPTVGADYAVLIFKDLDDDGIKEAIIETERWIQLEFNSPERHVLKFKTDEGMEPQFEYIDGPNLKEK